MQYSYETFYDDRIKIDGKPIERIRVTRLSDGKVIPLTTDCPDTAFEFADKYKGRGEVTGNTQAEINTYWNE